MRIFKINKTGEYEPAVRGFLSRRLSAVGAVVLAGTLCGLTPSALWAASPLADDDDNAPAKAQGTADARAVRLSSVDGQVKVIQGGQVIADPAYANMPLFEGTQISTGVDGRAEIQLEDGSVGRLSPNSSVTIPVMQRQGSDNKTEMDVNGGLVYFELQPGSSSNSARVRLGPASFTASSFSVVRVTLDQPPGELAVFSGNIHVEQGDAMEVEIHGGESLALNASDPNHYSLSESISSDSWDSWNADRDQALNAQQGERTAASGNYSNSQGFSDLDANGNWYNVPGQGYVWSPYDAQATGSSWDPYGYGQWVSYPSYGYVWVSGYDWGYAPYSCGMWNFYDGFGWGWAPGMSCNPWWGYGYGGYGYTGWGYNIGHAPHGYLPPRRPVPGPGHPRPVGSQPLRTASVIRVDRRPAGSEMAFYARPAQPVSIGGHTVEPLRPVAPRQAYGGTASGFVNRPDSGAMHPTYGQSYVRPATPGNFRPSAPSYSAPSYVSHAGSSASAPSYHPSYSGGGGGGGARPAGGGMPSGGGMPAGGGGGGGHPAGGGGGGGGTHR